MDNRNVVRQKPVKNSLLQTATYGFPLENMLSTNLIVPVSQADSTLPGKFAVSYFNVFFEYLDILWTNPAKYQRKLYYHS